MKTSLMIVISMTVASALAACDRGDTTAQRPDTSRSAPGSDAAKAAGDAADKVARNVQDTAVTTKVKAALLADEQVKGTDINVETTQGAVTLSGRTETPAQKQRAEQLAMNVDGVRAVNNNITTTN